MKRKYEKRLFALSIAALVICCAALAVAAFEYRQNRRLKDALVQMSKQAAEAEMAQLQSIFASRQENSDTAGRTMDFLNWKSMLQDELRGAAFRLKIPAEALRQAQRNKELAALLHYTLGLTYTATADFSAAKENFALALKYDPRDAESAYNLGLLYSLSGQSSDRKKAAQYYRLYLDLDPRGRRAAAAADKLKQLE